MDYKNILKYIFCMFLFLFCFYGFKIDSQADTDMKEIPSGHSIYYGNYIIGNFDAAPNGCSPTKTETAKGFTAYLTTSTDAKRYFSEDTGYDSSFKTFIDTGRPYSETLLQYKSIGKTSNNECCIVNDKYFTKGQVVKLETVAIACGHTNQSQTLWVYIYKKNTLLKEYIQICAPMRDYMHHIDHVYLYYKIPESGNYTIKVKGEARGCTNGYANGLSVYPTIYTYETYPYKIVFNANGGSGTPNSITAEGYDSSVVMGDIGNTVPTRTGYTFKGWSASSSWSSKRIVYSSSNGGDEARDGTQAAQTSSSWSYGTYCSNTGEAHLQGH